MHTEMWEQPSVQENLSTLRRRGVLVLEPDVGALAGGDVGAGRMREPKEIAELVKRLVSGFEGPLSGRRVLITAGGTREAIDPVRVISNRSSGRQGYALAEVARRLGATVTLVSSVNLSLALDVVRDVAVVQVQSASEMREEVLTRLADVDVVIMAAAVADFTLKASKEKLKKDQGPPTLHFEPTADIVLDLVAKRSAGQVIVGFAAETANIEQNALTKLRAKGVDLLVVNDVSAPNVGFEHPTNEVVILDREEHVQRVTLRSKEAVSYEILARVASLLSQGAS
jgi:phosphopantothenoylcysteine decarboxylase/phosphopantothenate--cysteine ligase